MSPTIALLRRPALTWNGALSYDSTDNACLDYWAKAGTFRDRKQAAVDADVECIFADNARLALAIVFGVRLITRKPAQADLEVQTGYGQRDEFAKALCWMHRARPELLYDNLHLIPVFGCWRDLVSEPLLSTLDRQKVYALVADNLDDALLLKYLPQPRSSGKARSDRDRARSEWAKGLCRHLGITEKEYRKLKSAGPAHAFQRQMGRGQWDDVHFNGIPGRAMTRLVTLTGKDRQTAFERHNQTERLLAWVREQPLVKFTGHPYELVRAARKRSTIVSREVHDRQFATVLEPMRAHNLGNVLCALDTSGSMTMEVVPGVSAYDVCISLGIAFSMLNVGRFADTVVAFGPTSQLVTLSGTFTERLRQVQAMTTAWGSTNFQSVINLIVRQRQQDPATPITDYPRTLLVVSDMQFNPAGANVRTNHEEAMRKLRGVGLGEMRVIWWYVNGKGADFPVTMDEPGTYLIGGFDPTVLKALLGLTKDAPDAAEKPRKEQTPLAGMLNFLSQPIFSLLTV